MQFFNLSCCSHVCLPLHLPTLLKYIHFFAEAKTNIPKIRDPNFHLLTVLCKSFEVPLFSLCFPSKQPGFLVIFKVALSSSSSVLSKIFLDIGCFFTHSQLSSWIFIIIFFLPLNLVLIYDSVNIKQIRSYLKLWLEAIATCQWPKSKTWKKKPYKTYFALIALVEKYQW